MCGRYRYRLSKRKQMIEEYFETERGRWIGSLATISPCLSLCRNSSPRSIQAGAALFTSPLGSDSVLGHGRQHRIQDHQWPRGDGRG